MTQVAPADAEKVLVMSCPEMGTLSPFNEPPYDQEVMAKVEGMQKADKVKMGFDRKGSSTTHPEDENVDWTDKEQVRSSKWMYGFVTAAKKVISTESQGFAGKLVIVCIEGGFITQVEAEEMQKVVNLAKKDAGQSGVRCRIELRTMAYCDFLQTYDKEPTPEPPKAKISTEDAKTSCRDLCNFTREDVKFMLLAMTPLLMLPIVLASDPTGDTYADPDIPKGLDQIVGGLLQSLMYVHVLAFIGVTEQEGMNDGLLRSKLKRWASSGKMARFCCANAKIDAKEQEQLTEGQKQLMRAVPTTAQLCHIICYLLVIVFGYAEQLDGAIGLALGMSAVIWAIFNFRALVAGVCTTTKALDRFTFQLRRTIGTAICLEIVFGLYYSAWYYQVRPALNAAYANGMTNDQIVSNDQDVGFCATQPVAFLVFFSFWLSAALGVGSGKIQLEQGVLVAANFVVVAISFTWASQFMSQGRSAFTKADGSPCDSTCDLNTTDPVLCGVAIDIGMTYRYNIDLEAVDCVPPRVFNWFPITWVPTFILLVVQMVLQRRWNNDLRLPKGKTRHFMICCNPRYGMPKLAEKLKQDLHEQGCEAWFDRKVHASWTDPEDDDKFPTSQNLLTEKHLQAMKKELASSMALLIMLPYTGEEAPVHWLDHKLIQLAREMKIPMVGAQLKKDMCSDSFAQIHKEKELGRDSDKVGESSRAKSMANLPVTSSGVADDFTRTDANEQILEDLKGEGNIIDHVTDGQGLKDYFKQLIHIGIIKPKATGGNQRLPSHRSAFASLRFDGEIDKAARELQAAMKKLQKDGKPAEKSLEIINMMAGGDITEAVTDGIEHCDTFIVFGSKKYGQDTGNRASTFYESKFAESQNKKIILIRMIPFDEEFEFRRGRFMFNLNMLELPWMLGTEMPKDLPQRIADAMDGITTIDPDKDPDGSKVEVHSG